jgi:tRNA-dihydrouridine synthase 2
VILVISASRSSVYYPEPGAEMGQPPDKRRPELYADKIVLAPMVRQSNLPFRLLCLKYGADLVYSEELIDYKLNKCHRLENKILGTVDFVDEQGDIVLRTDPSERDKFIVQIGSNNFERFIKAAKLVEQDVAGIDFNFGCPKKFSLAGGMGAAMLEKPEEIKSLLTQSVASLDLPITCKIRILPDLQKTLDLVRMIEDCGVSAIAVHGRTKEQRSSECCADDVVLAISKALTIPVIANGGSNNIKSYSDIVKFREKTGASSVMIARSAMKNPSIFKPDNQLEPIDNVVKEYLRLAVRFDNQVARTKYTLQSMLGSAHYGKEIVRQFQAAKNHQTLCDIFELRQESQPPAEINQRPAESNSSRASST